MHSQLQTPAATCGARLPRVRSRSRLRLAATRRRLGFFLILLLATGAAGCNKLKARDRLNKGVQAYKGGQYDAAIEDFKAAKKLDPVLLNARLYLATAYATLYIPGAPSEDNIRNGEQAVAEFREVLQMDPKNLSAIDGIASITFNMGGQPFDPKKFEEAREFHGKHIALKGDDPEPHYSIGVIEWTLAYAANKKTRNEYNATARKQVKDEEPMPTAVREKFVAEYGAVVENGIQHLRKAMGLRQEYEDAMAYLNLLYRQRADQVATPEERESLLQQADDLIERVKAIKQKKMLAPSGQPQP